MKLLRKRGPGACLHQLSLCPRTPRLYIIAIMRPRDPNEINDLAEINKTNAQNCTFSVPICGGIPENTRGELWILVGTCVLRWAHIHSPPIEAYAVVSGIQYTVYE